MLKMRTTALVLLTLLSLPVCVAAEQKDATGCKDHPLFTRMPNSWISSCKQSDFDAYEFPVGKGKKERVEGAIWKITYYPQATATSKPSELQILRNFENAVKKLGGTVVVAEKSRETLKLAKDGKEFWIDLWAEFTGKYGMTIVERKAMAQDIEANADVFADGLKTTGHAAVYGILFDTGKADIKPESAQAIGEIAKLLNADAGLKLHVVGHTDSVGSVDSNLKLSQARAEAVLQALVKEHAIAAGRLRAFGNGPFAPVASNDAEEGRAKNRRVELVKQ
jgi:outer membrane protein OmpA-like peptidoglycan-associated protein